MNICNPRRKTVTHPPSLSVPSYLIVKVCGFWALGMCLPLLP